MSGKNGRVYCAVEKEIKDSLARQGMWNIRGLHREKEKLRTQDKPEA